METRSRTSAKSSNSGVITVVDSDDDEFEDASETFNIDDYFIDNETSKRIEPLIPEDVEDEIVGCITFSEQFNNRYGPIHPAFYQGTLEDALKEATNKPAKDVSIFLCTFALYIFLQVEIIVLLLRHLCVCNLFV